MLGIGKNKKTQDEESEKKSGSPEKLPEVDISDENITTMPEKYRPAGSARSRSGNSGQKKINSRIFIIGGAAIVLLVALAVVLYLTLFRGNSANKEQQNTQTQANSQDQANQTPNTPNEPEPAVAGDKVVSAQAFDDTNQLAGTLSVTIPSDIVDLFGNSLGVTVLSSSDLELPEGFDRVGGLYSLYPNGVAFNETLSVEISAADIPVGVGKESFYPAFLAGTQWREIEGYSLTQAGWSFDLSKFPTGPISLIRALDVPIEENAPVVIDQIISTKDTDADGLTDAEETLLGTSSNAADSDGDTYDDRSELMNGYSPVAVGVSLVDSGLFSAYTNPTYGYSIQYPGTWLADSLDQTNKQVLFISDTEEFFEVLVDENPLNTPIVDWYRGQLSSALAGSDLDVTIVSGRPAVWSLDHLTLYTGKDGLVYIITYNKGTRDDISWPTIYELFYKSFTFGNTINDSPVDTSPAGDNSGDTTTTTDQGLGNS